MNSSAGFSPSQRIAAMGVSEILKISAKAAALKAQGRPVIVLGAGEPDFDTPDPVKDAACLAIRAGETKYTRLDGTPALKEAIAAKFRRENGLTYAANEISVGAGAKQIIFNAFMASLNEGDEVILAAPFWTSYTDMVAIAGGVPTVIVGKQENGFVITADELESAITPRTRWVLLNYPSNPSGAIASREQWRPLLDVLLRHPQVWLMSDEIYEHLTYDDQPFVSPLQVAPSLRERALIVNGVSKAYAMTGWRIGYGAGPAPLIAAMAVVQSQSTSNPSSVSQAAAVAALNGPQQVVRERRDAFQRRRDGVVAALNAIDGIDCPRPGGAFYVYASCAGLVGKTTRSGRKIANDSDFCAFLLEEHNVAVVPGACFGLAPYFRISYAASEADLTEACRRIAAACQELTL